MKNFNTKLVFSCFILLLSLSYSCNDKQESEIVTSLIEVPDLKSSKETKKEYLDQILRSNTSNGRITQSLLVSESATLIFEGYETLEIVQIPDSENPNLLQLYHFNDGQLVDGFEMQMINSEKSFSFITAAGEIEYFMDDNDNIIDMNVLVYPSNTGGRIECSPATGFLDCANTINDGLRRELGDVGAVIAELACGYFVACRVGLALTCTAVAFDGCT